MMYFRFDFADPADQVDATVRLLRYLQTTDSRLDESDRPMFWSTPLFASEPALYLSGGAVRAACLAAVPIGTGVCLPASKLRAGLILVFGREDAAATWAGARAPRPMEPDRGS
jgi:hypothetical protein